MTQDIAPEPTNEASESLPDRIRNVVEFVVVFPEGVDLTEKYIDLIPEKLADDLHNDGCTVLWNVAVRLPYPVEMKF